MLIIVVDYGQKMNRKSHLLKKVGELKTSVKELKEDIKEIKLTLGWRYNSGWEQL